MLASRQLAGRVAHRREKLRPCQRTRHPVCGLGSVMQASAGIEQQRGRGLGKPFLSARPAAIIADLAIHGMRKSCCNLIGFIYHHGGERQAIAPWWRWRQKACRKSPQAGNKGSTEFALCGVFFALIAAQRTHGRVLWEEPQQQPSPRLIVKAFASLKPILSRLRYTGVRISRCARASSPSSFPAR